MATMTTEEVLRKVKKLLALATSSNAHEAAQAAARAQEMLDRYQLSRAMLDDDATENDGADEDIFDFGRKGAHLDVSSTKQLQRWKGSLATVLCRANSCQAYLTNTRGKPAISIVGRPSDADKVRYLYQFIVREIDRLCDLEGKGCGRTWRNNFRYGAVEAIDEALKASKRRAADQLRRDAGADMFALVKVDQALAKLEKRDADVQAWVRQNLRLGSAGRSYSAGDYSARQAGRNAGKSINLNGSRGSLTSGAKSLTS